MVKVENDLTLHLEEAKRIRAELDGSQRLTDPFPEKPKGMRWDQYWDLYQKGTDAERALAGILQKPKLPISEGHVWKKSESPEGLFRDLSAPEVKDALSKIFIPERTQKILKSLDNVSKTNGVLVIDCSVNLATVLLIASHVNAKYISEIRHKDWSPFRLDLAKQEYEEGKEEFKALFHIDIPDFIFELNHYHQLMYELADDNSGPSFDEIELHGMTSLGSGVFSHVFSGEKPAISDVLSLRYTHHSLNYFAIFNWCTDSVTQGLIFDYVENSFAPVIAYFGDGAYEGQKGIWDCLIENCSCDDCDFYWEDEDFAIDSLDVRLGYENEYALSAWFYNLATVGYLNFDKKPSFSLDGIQKARCGTYLDGQRLRESLEKSKFFVDSAYFIYPLLPIRLNGNFHPIFSTDSLQSLLDTLEVSISRGRRTTFSSVGIKKFITADKKYEDSVLEVMGLNRQVWGSKRKLSEEDIRIFLDALEGFCRRESEAGRPHLAFIIGQHAWECGEPMTTKLAVRLLSNVPDSICHPIIKTVAQLHSESRF